MAKLRMRLTFNQIFDITEGCVTPKRETRVGDMILRPGPKFDAEMLFPGNDLKTLKEQELEVEIEGDTVVLNEISSILD